MSENVAVPDFLDIGEETQKAAAAAMDSGRPLKPPGNAKKATDKNGKDYYRWTEAAVIENAWRDGKDGVVTAIIQYKIRAGYPNEHERNWSRHGINFALLAGQENDPERKKKHEFMNNSSINALTTLFAATGYAPKTPGLSAKILRHMFPEKNQPGVTSPLVGKTVMLNIADAPNSAPAAKHDRRTNIESYLPDAPSA